MDPLNTSPVASGSQMPTPESPKSSVGPLAGAIIVILLLVAGGLYFWGAQLNKTAGQQAPTYIPSNDSSMPEAGAMQDTSSTNETVTITSDASAGLPAQSSSDDVSSIEADANAMNVDQLNSQNSAELNNI